MPVIPSFGSYAAKPDLAQSYLGGQRLALARDELAQEAAQAAARISLGYEQIAANRVANEMELAAKREVLSRQALMKAQEQEIEKAYRETQFGLRERELAQEDAMNQMRIREAANDFAAQQEYRAMVDSGVAPDAAMRRVGFGQPGFSNAIEAPRGTSDVPALNFQLSQLNAMERSIMDKYPGITARRVSPDDRKQLDDIQQRRAALQVPLSLQQPAPSGTNSNRTLRVVRDANGKLVIQR